MYNTITNLFPKALLAILVLSMITPITAQAATVLPLFKTELTDMTGKTGQMLTVSFAPGETSAKHRHNADVFVYVLEGSVIMQVEGGQAKTLFAGDTFHENPNDIHTISSNASTTEPAKILVFFVKDTGAPVSIPVE